MSLTHLLARNLEWNAAMRPEDIFSRPFLILNSLDSPEPRTTHRPHLEPSDPG